MTDVMPLKYLLVTLSLGVLQGVVVFRWILDTHLVPLTRAFWPTLPAQGFYFQLLVERESGLESENH